MSLSVQLGLLLSLGCAIVAILGFLFKQRGAVGAPPVRWRHPIRSTVALFSNRWWTLGILVAIGAWTLHVAALTLAPISLVQATIAGGLVLLTPIADKLFGFKVTRREWLGVGLTAAGLAFLAGTLGDVAESAYSGSDAGTLSVYVGLVSVLAVGLCVMLLGDTPRAGPVLAVSAGLLWGASDVTIKALSGDLGDRGLLVVLTPEALVILVVSLVGFVISARSLQIGPAVPIIAITNAAANICTIASGPVVFGEPVPEDPLGVAVRVLAFSLVIFAAALTPGPVERRGPAPAV
ncbi:MAG: DMT family transporter [Solirubrobacterales bacterium]|nr:DMT family transporter [Solirubrobacterales bacterium]